MNISDLDPSEISVVQQPDRGPSSAPPGQSLKLSDLDPNEVTHVADNAQEAKYGGLGQQALAFGESAARSGTLGASDYLENELAKYNPQLFGPEARRGRQEANPWTNFAGSLTGGAALIGATGGAGAIAEGAGATGLGAAALTGGIEGAAFGAGNLNSDLAMGDTNLNAQKILSELGMGAVGGSLIGSGLHEIGTRIGLGKALLKGTDGALPETLGTPPSELTRGDVPTSLDEIGQRVAAAKAENANATDLPEKEIALDAASRLNSQLKFPILDAQTDALGSADKKIEWDQTVELPGEHGSNVRDYQGQQKKELGQVLDSAINNVSPGYEPTSDASKAGGRASEALTEQYESVQAELAPVFEAIKDTPINDIDHLPGVLDYLTQKGSSDRANPNIANMFETGGDALSIKPYNTAMNIEKQTYNAIKQAVAALEDEPTSFKNVTAARKGLEQNIDLSKGGTASSEITQAKAAMMDYIQDAVQSSSPDLDVRDTFKKWKINEENKAFIQDQLGAKVGADFRFVDEKHPESAIIRKIFSNEAVVKKMQEILPDEEFKKLVADRLAIMKADNVKDGVFSSKSFSNQLNKSQYAMNQAFINNPEALQAIKDPATLMRIFPDATSANPSHSGRTFLAGAAKAGLNPLEHIKNVADALKDQYAQGQVIKQVNARLAQTSSDSGKLAAVQGILTKVNAKMSNETKALFKSAATIGGLTSSAAMLSDRDREKLSQKLGELQADPANAADNFAHNTQHLYAAAPNITQSLHNSIYSSAQFLQSKMPQQAVKMPYSPPWEPSIAQKNEFNRYYQAVNDPIGCMAQVRNGTLTNQAMEALQATNPHLLQEMRGRYINSITPEKLKTLSYPQRICLSKFLGQPLDENMTTQAIISNQASMSAPNLSQQTSEAQAVKSSKAGLGKLNLAGRASTRTNQTDRE